MSSFTNYSNENSPKNKNLSVCLPTLINKSKKCHIKNKLGLITPKDIDIFSPIFLMEKTNENNININENNINNSHKDIIKINIVKNGKNISWSKNPFLLIPSKNKENQEQNIPRFNATIEFIRTINQDSIESLIPCKPMLNSTASKSYMLEYSKSKKFQEDFKNSNDFFDTPKVDIKDSTPSTNSHAIVEEEDSINDIQDLLQYQEEHLPSQENLFVPIRHLHTDIIDQL